MKNWKRNFFFLAQGQFVSILGDKAFNTAAIILLSYHMDSGILTSIYSATPVILALILMLFGGAIADTYSKKTIMVISDFISGIMVLSFGAFLLLKSSTSFSTFLFLLIVKMGLSAISAFFLPATEGLIAEVLPEDNVIKGRSILASSSQVASFVGPGLAGIIIKYLSLPYLFILDGISYVLSAISEMFIHLEKEGATYDEGVENENIFEKIKQGVKYTLGTEGLSTLILLLLLINFFSAPISVLNGFYIKYHLQLGEEWVGSLLSAFALGSILGSFTSALLNYMSDKNKFKMFISIFPIYGILFMGMSFSHNPYLSLAYITLFSFLSVPLNIIIMSQIQIKTPNALISRVMSTTMVLANLVGPLGMAIAGVLVDFYKEQLFVLYIGMGIPFFILVPFMLQSKKLRSFFMSNAKNLKEC